MKIQKPVLGKITQGTIFNCATADRYRGKLVYGLTITARCDLANDKYPVLNYLPIVTLFDWVHCDGLEILHANSLKSAQGNFKSLLKQYDIALSILNSVSRETVVANFFEDEGAKPSQRKQAGTARDLAALLAKLEKFNIENIDDRNWLIKTYSKDSATLIKDLINNKVSSFYYIHSATEDNGGEGYVVLLRESAFLPRRIAEAVALGVDRPTDPDAEINLHLSFALEDFAMPVGLVPSPNIEHILQTFSYMFGRIGLEDYSPEFIAEVCNRKFLKEGTTA